MIDLDDFAAIRKLDSRNTFESLIKLPDQCRQAWDESSVIDFPKGYENAGSIVVAGMGGSTYGARIVKSLYDGAEMTKVPLELANGYHLPGYVSKSSLVILSSYSGDTEETLACMGEAEKKRALITGITSGGSLAQFLRVKGYPGYVFDPKFNPCDQPRIGVGYTAMGLVGMLAKLKFIPLGDAEVNEMLQFLLKQTQMLDNHADLDDNHAKKLAMKLAGKIPVFIVADFLEGAAYAVRNPFHETGKQFALHFVVPELNHHLLEGLSYPESIKKSFVFIFVLSDIYDGRNKKRMALTKEIVAKNGFEMEEIKLRASSALIQTMEFIQLGNWITFYLAMLHGVDPAEIPWVTYLKEKLKEGKI